MEQINTLELFKTYWPSQILNKYFYGCNRNLYVDDCSE